MPTDSPGLLAGIRVVDVTHFLAGPYATMIMADLGAEVIKLEDPDRPDEARAVGPYFQGGQSLYFSALNTGKLSLALRLGHASTTDVLRELIRSADVVIDNYRAGVMRRLGLDRDTVAAINPRAVTCSITGFGGNGPRAELPAYDYTVQALTGVMSMTGEPDGPPAKAGISYVDHSGGLAGALAVCAALVERSRTGTGRHLDVSLYDVQVSMLSYLASWSLNAGFAPTRVDHSAHPSLVPAQNFAVADGWISVFVGNDAMWARFVSAVGAPSLADPAFATNAGRGAHRARVIAAVSSALKSRGKAEWAALLGKAGVPCGAVNELGEALEDPQIEARRLTRSVPGASYGTYSVVTGPFPMHTTASPGPAPRLGEHTRRVLTRLGYSDAAVGSLVADGAAVTPD